MPVVDIPVWTHRVVVTWPVFEGLLQRVEDLAVEQFIAQLAVEAFAIAILLWISRFDSAGPVL